MQGILSNLENALSAKGAAWGGDGYGSTFADGPQGYRAACANLTEGIGNTATTLDSYSDGQYRAAKLLEENDRQSARNMR